MTVGNGFLFFLVFGLFFLLTGCATSSVDLVAGVVKDFHGKAVGGATISMGISTDVSDSEGFFCVTDLAGENFDLKIEFGDQRLVGSELHSGTYVAVAKLAKAGSGKSDKLIFIKIEDSNLETCDDLINAYKDGRFSMRVNG